MGRGTKSPFREFECGTYARYRQGCRCDDCRAANRAYYHKNQKDRIWRGKNPWVSAERAREHLLMLSAAGVGTNTVTEVSGVSRSSVQGIRVGRQQNVRQRVEARILSVTPDAKLLNDALLVDAGPTWRLLNKLLDLGYTRTEIARRLGSKAKAPALQIDQKLVTNANKVKVEKLYAAIMEERKTAAAEARAAATAEAEARTLPDIDWRPEWLTKRETSTT